MAATGLLWLLAVPAHAAENVTINTTTAYVDEAVAAEFVTIPNLCTEPVGSQGTSPAGCADLGERAVLAIAGISPYGDNYFESATTPLVTTNSFVPGNSGSAVNNTGYAPIFSDHKYDLFGRAGDRMGPLTRREILLMGTIPTTGDGITTGQTTPGEDTLEALVVAILVQAEGATSFNLGGFTWQISDLPSYQAATGFTSGKLDTITAFCETIFDPITCGILPPEFRAQLYIAVNLPELFPAICGTQQNALENTTNCGNRDDWVDQVVAGYVEAWESLGGDAHFVQNFRSQVGYDGTSTLLNSTTEVWTDFRLEQSVELSGAFTTEGSDPGDTTTPGDNVDGIAGRQTFQQAIATESLDDFGFLLGPETIGQMVSQDVQGYFFSCLNCDTAGNGGHGFEPAKADLVFMPYDSGWNEVPTIVHAGL